MIDVIDIFDVDDMIDELDDDICESVIKITNNINTININRTIHTFVSDDDDDDDDNDDDDDGDDDDDDDDGFFSTGGVVGGIYSNFEYVLEGCWYIILSGFVICFDIDVEYDDGVYV